MGRAQPLPLSWPFPPAHPGVCLCSPGLSPGVTSSGSGTLTLPPFVLRRRCFAGRGVCFETLWHPTFPACILGFRLHNLHSCCELDPCGSLFWAADTGPPHPLITTLVLLGGHTWTPSGAEGLLWARGTARGARGAIGAWLHARQAPCRLFLFKTILIEVPGVTI